MISGWDQPWKGLGPKAEPGGSGLWSGLPDHADRSGLWRMAKHNAGAVFAWQRVRHVQKIQQGKPVIMQENPKEKSSPVAV